MTNGRSAFPLTRLNACAVCSVGSGPPRLCRDEPTYVFHRDPTRTRLATRLPAVAGVEMPKFFLEIDNLHLSSISQHTVAPFLTEVSISSEFDSNRFFCNRSAQNFSGIPVVDTR